MQPNALLIRQNFVIAKSGCYRDPDWVVAMEEELNNFKCNEVWPLVERPKLNVVGTK
jgi:hypothetical protein